MRNARDVCKWLLLVSVAAGVASCTRKGGEERGRLYVVLIDRSASTLRDAELAQRAVDQLVMSLQAGDRLLAGWITEKSGEDFRSYLDEQLPPPLPPLGPKDVVLHYRKRQKELESQVALKRTRILDTLRAKLSAPGTSPQTLIFESIWVASQTLAGDRRPRKTLYLISDMVEESSVADFTQMPLDQEARKRLLGRLEQKGLLPALQGVQVCVAGATATPVERAAAIEAFWREYFGVCGARLARGGYSRGIPACEE